MLPVTRPLLGRAILSGTHLIPCRRISTAHLDPIIQDFTTKLATRQPAFSLPPQRIRVLKQPSEFYTLLLDAIRRAEHRVFISSLYIGSEDAEIINVIANELKKKPLLHVFFQLDLNRSTRPGPSSTAKLLLPLLETLVHVSMFRSPSLRGLMAKIVPPRFNEGWGTWHAKVYGVDNEVIISGANLNQSYFTDRQDRYLHFSDQPLLAQYCFDFLRTVAKFSFRLLPISTPNATTPHSILKDDYILSWPDNETHPHHIHAKAKDALLKFQSSRRVLLFPIIQAGQFDIREEELTLQSLFRSVNVTIKKGSRKRPLFDLTSGYFSLYQPYQKLILGNRNLDVRIVAASPKANGFFGSSGISGRIPEGYTYHEKRFMRAVRKAGRLWREAASGSFKGVQLSEWNKPSWTYHAKGVWLSPSSKSLPILTLFGSTNLNARSAHLDTELSFLLILPSLRIAQGEGTDSKHATATTAYSSSSHVRSGADDGGSTNTSLSLRERLQCEIDGIRANASAWKGARRSVRFSTKLIVWLVKGML
ncbi:CDP-diacylglycerol--glycerol-3-phosphate 3-phosphatidyltransferase, mitochondrial [Leucoagaricus sp. SymC.cos]|nr:CDP-diacylglycerol--glycerol-3-phosphate 3-phosphatidyltransferase, mitochondrial [Leucoagaricus sp. SymC.cos]